MQLACLGSQRLERGLEWKRDCSPRVEAFHPTHRCVREDGTDIAGTHNSKDRVCLRCHFQWGHAHICARRHHVFRPVEISGASERGRIVQEKNRA